MGTSLFQRSSQPRTSKIPCFSWPPNEKLENRFCEFENGAQLLEVHLRILKTISPMALDCPLFYKSVQLCHWCLTNIQIRIQEFLVLIHLKRRFYKFEVSFMTSQRWLPEITADIVEVESSLELNPTPAMARTNSVIRHFELAMITRNMAVISWYQYIQCYDITNPGLVE